MIQTGNSNSEATPDETGKVTAIKKGK